MGSNRLKPCPSFAAEFLLAAVSGVFFMTPLPPPQALAEESEAPQLGLPIRCFLGQDCWLVNLVDVDPGPGRQDYTCSNRTYDGHKGVDIAIRDLMASDGHRSIILNTNFTHIGVAVAFDGAGMKYFTMVFLGPP